MQKTFIKRTLYLLILSGIVLVSSASSCDGDSNGSNQTVQNDATYEFESISLMYDIPQKLDDFTRLDGDLGELSIAHGINGTEFQGVINDLNSILVNEGNYPVNRKPEIKITMKLYDNTMIEHYCSKNDIGNNYVQNIPNYGANIINLQVSVKSILTSLHSLQLCWKKTFDLTNSQWWEPNLDKALSGNADVDVIGYTKYAGSDGQYFVRNKNGTYEMASYVHEDMFPDLFEAEIIVTTPEITPPNMFKPIYVGGELNEDVEWDSPGIVEIDDIKDSF